MTDETRLFARELRTNSLFYLLMYGGYLCVFAGLLAGFVTVGWGLGGLLLALAGGVALRSPGSVDVEVNPRGVNFLSPALERSAAKRWSDAHRAGYLLIGQAVFLELGAAVYWASSFP